MTKPAIESLVLDKLARWQSLALSDLVAMLPQERRGEFSSTVLRQMEEAGLVSVRTAGDEPVVRLISPREE
jgi:hypothetical protein